MNGGGCAGAVRTGLPAEQRIKHHRSIAHQRRCLLCRHQRCRVRIADVGFKMEGVGFRSEGSRYSLDGVGFSLEGVGFRIEGVRLRIEGVGFQIEGAGLKV